MSITLYDATDVIPSGFDGTAFEPVLRAVAEVCGAPFDTQTPNSTVYRMAAVYALAHGMDDLLVGDSDILNTLAAALRIPAWRQLARAETEDKRRLAARTLRAWLQYRGRTGGRVPSAPAVVYDDGTSYVKPEEGSFIALLLAGGATAVSAVRSWDGKDTFRMFAERPDDLLLWVPPYDPDTFDGSFNDYLTEQYSHFLGIFGTAHLAIEAGLESENTELYSIGSHIQYDAIHDYMRNAYSIDGGISWMSSGELYDAGLMTTRPYFGPLHDENVGVGDPWSFSQGNVAYLRNSDDAYPFDAPYTRCELTEVITYGGTTMHGYDGTYTANVATDYSEGLSQPEITDDTGTLESFGDLSVVAVSAYFIPADLVDDEVYTNDYARTPTPAWSYTKGGRTWYFVRDRIGYDKTWVYKEDGLNGEGYRSSPFPMSVTVGVTTSIPAGATKIQSGWWWMDKFGQYSTTLRNLWDPEEYASVLPVQSSQDQTPNGTEYGEVYFWTGSSLIDLGAQGISLYLNMYPDMSGRPELYTNNQSISVQPTNAGIIIAPGSAPTWTNNITAWDLPSTLYTISGTTLTWNTSHPLYPLLVGKTATLL